MSGYIGSRRGNSLVTVENVVSPFNVDGSPVVENGELKNVNLTSSVGNLPSNRNLIINGDFRVNQRGAASRTENMNAYNYDRWYYDGTYLYQGVEDKSVANGTYTLSWVDAGSDITAAYIVSTDSSNRNGPDSGLTYTSVSNGGSITVSEGTEYSKHLWIRFGGTLASLSKVQLIYGSVATPFELRSYGEELALCQRYYYQTTFYETSLNSGATHTEVFYHSYQKGVSQWEHLTSTFPVTMRVSPSITTSDVNGTAGKFTYFTSTGGSSAGNYTPYTTYSTKEGFKCSDYNGSNYGFSYDYKADAEL